MSVQINYKEFYEDSPDMLFSVEASTGNVIECNSTLLTSLGYSKEEVLSKHVTELYHSDDFDRVSQNYLSFKNTGTLIHSEFKALKKNGEIIEVTLKLTPIYDDSGNILYSNAAWRDISEINQMQRIIQEEKDKSEKLLLNILPESIAERLKESESIIADAIPSASILFSDIVGFTALADKITPDELIEILNQIFTEFDHLAEKYKLEKIKTIGDAYMVASGVPSKHENHAVAIAGMALDMLNVMSDINKTQNHDLQIRIGIHSGPVVAGVIGKKKFSYDLWGESVNTASRMESHGVPGSIQVSQTTYELLRNDYSFEDRGEIQVKGKGLMSVYFLVDRI